MRGVIRNCDNEEARYSRFYKKKNATNHSEYTFLLIPTTEKNWEKVKFFLKAFARNTKM